MGNFYASVTGTSVIQQRKIDLPPGATTGFGLGEYNPTPYEGEGGRGWCIFELRCGRWEPSGSGD